MLVGTRDKEDKASLSRAQTDCDKFYNHKWSLYNQSISGQDETQCFSTCKARQRNVQSSKLLKVERQSRGKFHEIVSEEFLICKETPPLLAGCVVLYSIVYLYYLLCYLY